MNSNYRIETAVGKWQAAGICNTCITVLQPSGMRPAHRNSTGRKINCSYHPASPDHGRQCLAISAPQFKHAGTGRQQREVMYCTTPDCPFGTILFFPGSGLISHAIGLSVPVSRSGNKRVTRTKSILAQCSACCKKQIHKTAGTGLQAPKHSYNRG